MENVCDSAAYGELTASTDPNEELITSLASFSRVYSQRRDGLQRASEGFTLRAALLRGILEADSKKAKRSHWLFAIGGFVGAACGGYSGGVGGIFGGVVVAATYIDTSPLGAIVGFAGSVLGGVAGGAVGGAVGGSVCASAKVTGGPIHGVVSKVAWLTLGCATGSVVGCILGGKFGATGGALGGVYGAFFATKYAGRLAGFFFTKFCQEMMKKSEDFCENITPLVDELKTINTTSDKMASGAVVRGVAGQTAKTLASVASMVKLNAGSRSASDLPRFASSFEAEAKQSKNVSEEMEEMSAEAGKLLVSLNQEVEETG